MAKISHLRKLLVLRFMSERGKLPDELHLDEELVLIRQFEPIHLFWNVIQLLFQEIKINRTVLLKLDHLLLEELNEKGAVLLHVEVVGKVHRW